jgi:folate-binding protein YgfZ
MPNLIFMPIIVQGEDAETFLQGQLTCDVTKVTETPSLGAYCDIKGRVLANFWIEKISDGYTLYVPDSIVSKTLETLKKYGAFSKVDIAQAAAITAEIESDRFYFIKAEMAFVFGETSLLFTPQMIAWEKQGGVSFEKGCYLGQEIVARTQHLGKLKRHLHRFECHITLSSPGDKLLDNDDKAVGVICDAISVGHKVLGLAVIQDKALDKPINLNHEVISILT